MEIIEKCGDSMGETHDSKVIIYLHIIPYVLFFTAIIATINT